MTSPPNEGRYALGDYTLQSGDVIEDAFIVYKTHGTLSPAKDNVILYPTSYSATHAELEWLIGAKGILDPTRWFIVIPNMFGSGLSSSPSNTPNYPSLVTSTDNVHAQRRLLQDIFGIEKLAGVYGFSMGAQQAYHWAALYPDAVERIVVVCGSARTAVHNQVFLLSVAAILEAAPEHVGNGRFSAPPTAALRAFGRSYAAWAMSQDFYRAGLHSVGPQSVQSGRLSAHAMGSPLRAARCGQSLRAAEDLDRRRHQREPALQRRSGQGSERDYGARAPDAQRNRSLLPRCRQRSRASAPEVRGAGANPEHLGPPGRQSIAERGRWVVPEGPRPTDFH